MTSRTFPLGGRDGAGAIGTVNPYRLQRTSVDTLGPVRTAIDLFSGAGGITLGILNAGFDVRLCSDNDSACTATHRRNFPKIPFRQSDIETLSGARVRELAGVATSELDLLIGGPPCQGFSIIGQRELQDPRNSLFQEFMRLAEDLQPKVIVIENVSGLATLHGGIVMQSIAKAFAKAGYVAQCAELLAAQYGVPQMRWRMFFIGWRADLGRRGGFPQPTHGTAGIGILVPNRTIQGQYTEAFLTIREAIGDLPPLGAGECLTRYGGYPVGAYQEACRERAPATLSNHYAARLSSQNMERLKRLKPGEDWRSLPFELLPAGMQRALRKDHTRRYRRMQWNGVARSIITRFRDPKSGEYIHPSQNRTISIREAARIQSFPDWFVFEGSYSNQYVQVGNAVPPILARAVAAELKTMLDSPQEEIRSQVKSRYLLPETLPVAAAAG